MITPTEEQINIIEESNNCVVIAKPGSGKTFILSEKIRNIIPELPMYKGVIAISFTNKASNELKQRCLSDGLFPKESFFGTIDRFFISEIIIPFGIQIFGLPAHDIKITSIRDLDHADKNNFSWLKDDFFYPDLRSNHIELLKSNFNSGIIYIETIGLLSLYIFDNSKACQKYIKARYSHVIIDEYQDSGMEQHELFLRLQEMGLISIAVGDADQSIYAFAGKNSKYLLSLPKNKKFKFLSLTYNHRSHPSIINYSSVLLRQDFELLNYDRINIFEKQVVGDETKIANWIDRAVPFYLSKFDIKRNKEVAVLARNNRTAGIIDDNLQLNHKLFLQTNLDVDINKHSVLFRNLLICALDQQQTKYNLLDSLIDINDNKIKTKSVYLKIQEIERLICDFNNLLVNKNKIINISKKICEEVFGQQANIKSLELLEEVINDKRLVESYRPAKNNEIQIMTLHKSKGLEFDLVFHLDLYEYIMPSESFKENGQRCFNDYEQDINLHYVGITRAKKCCILTISTQRNNFRKELKVANKSIFFNINNLEKLRIS